MTEKYLIPLTVSIASLDKSNTFVPYKENFDFTLDADSSMSFDIRSSEEAIYYTKQATESLLVNTSTSAIKSALKVGTYSDGIIVDGASFSAFITSAGTTDTEGEALVFNVLGTLPYQAADSSIGMPAGNRFMAVLSNSDITSKSDLPSGTIITISNSDGTTQTYTKAAFEDDGTLFIVTNERLTSVLTILVEWVSGKISSYTFNFLDAKLGAQNEVLEDVQDIKITLPSIVTLTNISGTAVTFVPYKENYTASIAAGDSLQLTATKAEQVMYYLKQKSEKLTINY